VTREGFRLPRGRMAQRVSGPLGGVSGASVTLELPGGGILFPGSLKYKAVRALAFILYGFILKIIRDIFPMVGATLQIRYHAYKGDAATGVAFFVL